MTGIVCIYCNEKHDKLEETRVLRAREDEDDHEVRLLECKKCGESQKFIN